MTYAKRVQLDICHIELHSHRLHNSLVPPTQLNSLVFAGLFVHDNEKTIIQVRPGVLTNLVQGVVALQFAEVFERRVKNAFVDWGVCDFGVFIRPVLDQNQHESVGLLIVSRC